MSERGPKLDLDAAMAALEGRSPAVPVAGEGDAVAQAARLPRRSPRQAVKGQPTDASPLTRIRSTRTDRIHMFSTRASAGTLNALYALARDERRTVTELFEEAVELLEGTRARRRCD
jgi:hypothetical protein